MKLGINQPMFLPWLGFFDLLDKVDFFVVLNNVQLVKCSFMVRNRLLDATNKIAWFSERVTKCPLKTPMNEAYISTDEKWWTEMYRRIAESYKKKPYWTTIDKDLLNMLEPKNKETVAVYNWRIIIWLCDILGLGDIKNRFKFASDIKGIKTNDPQTMVLDICKIFEATDFYNFKKGIEIGIYNPDVFKMAGINLWQHDYNHPTYPQGKNANFVPYLSVLDLICCVGPQKALQVIREGSNWYKVN